MPKKRKRFLAFRFSGVILQVICLLWLVSAASGRSEESVKTYVGFGGM